eukprot:gene9114-1638_t
MARPLPVAVITAGRADRLRWMAATFPAWDGATVLDGVRGDELSMGPSGRFVCPRGEHCGIHSGWALSATELQHVYLRWGALGYEGVPMEELQFSYGKPMMPVEAATFLSHRRAWQHVVDLGYDACLILEDDVCPYPFPPNVQQLYFNRWNHIQSTLADTVEALGAMGCQWDILYLGRHRFGPDGPTVLALPAVLVAGFSTCLHAYAISRSGAAKLLAAGLHRRILPVDDILPALYAPHPRPDVADAAAACGVRLSALAFSEDLVWQLEVFTDQTAPAGATMSDFAAMAQAAGQSSVDMRNIAPDTTSLAVQACPPAKRRHPFHSYSRPCSVFARLPPPLQARCLSYLPAGLLAALAQAGPCGLAITALFDPHPWRRLACESVAAHDGETIMFSGSWMQTVAGVWAGPLLPPSLLGVPLLCGLPARLAQMLPHSAMQGQAFCLDTMLNHSTPCVFRGQYCGINHWTWARLLSSYPDRAFAIAVPGEHGGPCTVQMALRDYDRYSSCHRDLDPLVLFEACLPTDLATCAPAPPASDDDLLPGLAARCRGRADCTLDMLTENRWLVAGPSGAGFPLHTDPYGTSAWNVLTEGRKLWCMFPPSPTLASPDTDQGNGDCVGGQAALQPVPDLFPPGVSPVPFTSTYTSLPAQSWFTATLPLLMQHQGLCGSGALPDCGLIWVVQEAGDVVWVPAGWWHTTLNLERCVTYTQNTVPIQTAAHCAQIMEPASPAASQALAELVLEQHM